MHVRQSRAGTGLASVTPEPRERPTGRGGAPFPILGGPESYATPTPRSRNRAGDVRGNTRPRASTQHTLQCRNAERNWGGGSEGDRVVVRGSFRDPGSDTPVGGGTQGRRGRSGSGPEGGQGRIRSGPSRAPPNRRSGPGSRTPGAPTCALPGREAGVTGPRPRFPTIGGVGGTTDRGGSGTH